MGITDDQVLQFEVSLLANETVKEQFRWEKAGGDRSYFVNAQVVYCGKLLEHMIDNPDAGEEEIVEMCEESLALQQELLEKARAEDDRKWRIITLARIRFMKTLLRRLQDSRRRAALLAGDPGNLIFR